ASGPMQSLLVSWGRRAPVSSHRPKLRFGGSRQVPESAVFGRGTPVASAGRRVPRPRRSRGEVKEEHMRAMLPWTGMTNLKQELDRFFGPFGELKLDEFPALGDWAP